MNSLYDNLISHIFRFIGEYELTTLSIISKRFHLILTNQKRYVLANTRMKWRENRNKSMISEMSGTLDIIKPRGIMSEAVFFIVVLNNLKSNRDLHDVIVNHRNQFTYAFDQYKWTIYDNEIPEMFDYMDDVVVNKRIVRPIRLCQGHFDLSIASLPLHYYTSLNFITDISSRIDDYVVQYRIYMEKI